MMKMTYYKLPEEQTERVNRTEMMALRWTLAAINSLAYGQDDLDKRLDFIPNGKVRYRLMLGQLRAICNDLLGTIPEKQRNTIKNVMNDMELRMVPKFSPKANRVCMGIEDLSYLVDHAKKDICTACIFDGDECRQCELYQIMSSIAPLEDWGSSSMCPYSREDWWDK